MIRVGKTPRISLARGVPSTDLLAASAIAEAARDAILTEPNVTLGYGDPVGHPLLRAWFADLLEVDAERVLLTNGSLQGLAFLAGELAGASDWIAVEQPTYDFSLRQLESTGARLVGFEVEHDGLDVRALEREVAASGAPAFCYTIPTFHNPTGRTMTGAKRRALIGLAQAHGFLVIEDDPYRMLRFDGEQPRTLLSLDPERVIHLTSLTKIVAPGLRCGAVVMVPELRDRIAEIANRAYIAPGHFAQGTGAHFVRAPDFEAGLARTIDELRLRRDRLLDGLRRIGLECDTPSGGYFAWPETGGVSATALAQAASDQGLDVVAGTQFFFGTGGEDRLRLTWAAARVEEIDEAIERLDRALVELTSGAAA